MKEKQFVRTFIIQALIIIGVYLIVQLISVTALSKDYSEPLFSSTIQSQLGINSADDVEIVFEEDGIISLKNIYMKNGIVWITLTPEKTGRVTMTAYNKNSGEKNSGENVKLSSIDLTASPDGTITDGFTGNFTHHRLYHLYIVLLSLAFTLLLWYSFVKSYRKLRYSYQSVFCSGMAIWLSMITFFLTVTWFRNDDMSTMYNLVKSSAFLFILCSVPFILIFSIAMSISNVSLIRHEGFRSRNALGIIISAILVIGAVFGVATEYLYTPVTERKDDLFTIFENVYHVTYAYMECFLIGAILCGTLAALHRPTYDKDYIVILGCKVKKDGTLYPLIRGRVDKAIEFYRDQLEKTGKKAVFVPSGGQGSDEQVSEADAMKRYLLEQGIEESQILVENQSKNTLQNMRFSHKLIQERTPNARSAFSTTNFHVFRSGIISRQCEFEPDGMGSKTKWYFWPNAYMREAIGMLVFKKRSVIIMLIPIVAFFVAVQLIF